MAICAAVSRKFLKLFMNFIVRIYLKVIYYLLLVFRTKETAPQFRQGKY